MRRKEGDTIILVSGLVVLDWASVLQSAGQVPYALRPMLTPPVRRKSILGLAARLAQSPCLEVWLPLWSDPCCATAPLQSLAPTRL